MKRRTRNWIVVVLAVVGFALLANPVAAQQDDDDYTPPEVAGVVVEQPAPQPVAKTGTDSMVYVRMGVAAIVLGAGMVALSKRRRRAQPSAVAAGGAER